MPLEIEAKFLVNDFAPVRTKLEALGYSCTKLRTLMQRRTFLLTEKENVVRGASQSEWARVRNEGDKVTMTYKHAFDNTSAAGTEEIDLVVNDFAGAVAFMQKLGFTDAVIQENYREAWELNGVQTTLDEWPVIGGVVEVEGPSEALVKKACTDLGFDYTQAVFGGVGSLYYAKYGKDMGLVRELTFAKTADISIFLNS